MELNQTTNNWYDKKWLVYLLCVLFFPVGLFALWKNNSISKGMKIGISALIGIIVIASINGDKNSTSASDSKTETQTSEELSTELSQAQRDSILVSKKESKAKAEKDLTSFKKNEDDFEGNVFYRDPRTPKYNNVNFIYPYIGKNSDQYWLRLNLQYASEDWLFINNAILMIDNEKFNVSGKWERDNNSGIWEWLDIPVDETEYIILKKIVNSKTAKVRYEGKQYHEDRNITEKEKSIIKKTLEIYDALK
jgi:hypothetical protein